MRLKYQLFLILILTSALLIALMALIGSRSFDRGFIGYINNTEQQQLLPLVDALADGYEREGSWDWLTDKRRAWKDVLDTHLGPGRVPRPGRERDRRPGDRPAGRPAGRPPEQPGKQTEKQISRSNGADGLVSTLTLDPRLLLADAEKRILIGRREGNRRVHWQPVMVDEQTVGYLGHRQRDTLPGRLDQAFAAQQRNNLIYASLAMVLLSGLLAIGLAGRLVRPLLKVNDAVSRIRRGQYDYRVPNQRKDEIGNLSESINALAETLEKNLDARRQWLAEISHELRTPVAILQGELEAMQDGVRRIDEEAIASLHAETLRLARDLHDLTLSDVGALDYRFERLDLGDVLSERLATARSNQDAETLSIHLDADSSTLAMEGDAQRLGQLIDNLLQNSLRYTDAGGEVRIALSRTGKRAAIDWSDSSPGVDDEQLSRLFEPLYRADSSRNRGNGGAGLGLAIVQRIVEAHRGTIAASRSSLGGLALHIEFPLAPDDSA